MLMLHTLNEIVIFVKTSNECTFHKTIHIVKHTFLHNVDDHFCSFHET